MIATREPKPFISIDPIAGSCEYAFHAGQAKAMRSQRRFVAVIAGTQSGKTVFGPAWLFHEMMQRGPGDYLVVTPTFPLLELKALPEFRRLFESTLHLGRYVGSPSRRFVLSSHGERKLFGKPQREPTTIYFGYAAEPESLESATVKAAWLDEAGQKRFRLSSWEAILRRLSIHQGRALITTTPYDLGWLKQKIHGPWKSGDPTIDVIRFESISNPAFPLEEFERARRDLPRWKFDLFYRGIFSRPAGLIYDCFDPAIHQIKRFPIPKSWQRFVGLDFGGVHTAAIFFARRPGTDEIYAYREYLAGGRTATGHVIAMRQDEPSLLAVGGSGSEQQWRDEFSQAGLAVLPPTITEVEVGINRVYAAIQRGTLFVFDDLSGLLDEFGSYARETDEAGNVTEVIADKSMYHYLDAVRYIVSWLHRAVGSVDISMPGPRRTVLGSAPAGTFTPSRKDDFRNGTFDPIAARFPEW